MNRIQDSIGQFTNRLTSKEDSHDPLNNINQSINDTYYILLIE